MFKRVGHTVIGCMLFALVLHAPGVRAESERNGADTVDALIQLLIVKGVITREEADDLLHEIRTNRESASRESEPMAETYPPLEIAADRLAPVDSWWDRIALGGDIRLRYHGHYYDNGNGDFLDPADPESLLNTHIDRHRFRYRVRLDAKAKLLDSGPGNAGEAEVGIRISTGNEKDPISTNDTLGDYQNRDAIQIDLGYLKWAYESSTPVWGKIPGMSFAGGRIENPWFAPSNLVWDFDLNFEGAAVKLMSDTRKSALWSAFINMGVFSIQEVDFSSRDKWMIAAQAGLEAEPFHGVRGTLGVAYYEYQNMEGQVNDPLLPGETDFSAPLFQQKGNTLIDIDPSTGLKTALAADYHLLNISGKAAIDWFSPVMVSFIGDFVMNLGFDIDRVRERTGVEAIPEDIFGYQLGVEVGYSKIREFGQWKGALQYRLLQSDAVLDAFTDSDFHDGGTNTRGWMLGFEYGLFHDIWMSLKWQTSDEIAGPPLSIDVLQIDLNARF